MYSTELTAVGLSIRIDANGLVELPVVLATTWSDHLPYDGSIRCDFDKLVTGRAKRITIGQAVSLAVGSQFPLTAGMSPTPHHLLGLDIEFDKSVGSAQRQQHIAILKDLRFVVTFALNFALGLHTSALILAFESPVPDHSPIRADFGDGAKIAHTDQRVSVFQTRDGIHMHPSFIINSREWFAVIVSQPFPRPNNFTAGIDLSHHIFAFLRQPRL
jgi:hypothetical protein